MAAMVSSQSNASTDDDWRIQFEEIMRRMGSMEKSTIDPIDLSSKGAASRKESKGRTLLLKIHLLRYSISWEELDCLFARFGRIECIEVFCPGEQYHSRIRFQQKDSAIRAIESFNHRNIYDGCCRMELILEAEIDDGFQEPKNQTQPLLHISEHRSTAASASEAWERRIRMQDNLRRMEELVKKLHEEPCRSKVQGSTEEEGSVETEIDNNAKIETPIQTTLEDFKAEKQEMQAPGLATVGGIQDCQQKGNETPVANADQIGAPVAEVNQQISEGKDLQTQYESSKKDDGKKPSDTEINGIIEGSQIGQVSCKVTSDPLEAVFFNVALKEKDELGYVLAETIETKLIDFRMNSIGIFESTSAHQVFEVISRQRDTVVFDPGGVSAEMNLILGQNYDHKFFKNVQNSLPFDRGRHITTLWVNPEAIWVVQAEKPIPAVTLNFDPGGEMAFMLSCMSCASKETVFTCSWWIKIDASVARGSGLRIIWRSQWAKSAHATDAVIDIHRLLEKVLVFDPGGSSHSRRHKWDS